MTAILERMAMKKFAQNAEKGLIKDSLWEQLSNRWDHQVSIANAAKQLPDNVIHNVPGSNDKRARSVTVTMTDRLKAGFVAGSEPAKGKEKGVGIFDIQVYYNVWRIPYKMSEDGSPAETYAEWYVDAKNATSLAKDTALETRDYFKTFALIEGGDPTLVMDKYWADSRSVDFRTAPVTRRLHPHIFYKGQTTAITRSSTYATDLDNICTAAASMTATSAFDLSSARAIATRAKNLLRPLHMKAGPKTFFAVCFLTEIQAEQLANDTNWVNLMKDTEQRGPENRALSGILGIYRGVLFLENPRGAILRLDSGSRRFEYVTPELESVDYFFGEQSLNRVAKAAAATAEGTLEVAMVMGAGALYKSNPEELFFKSESDDYEFRKGFVVGAREGVQRPDFKKPDGTYYNATSFAYLTGTPSFSM